MSNPHNSKMQSGSQRGHQNGAGNRNAAPAGEKRNAPGTGNRNGAQQQNTRNANGRGQNRPASRIGYEQPKLIKPLTKPSQPQMPDERLEEQKRRKEAAERAFVITPWEQIIGLLQRSVPGAYKQGTMSGPRRSGRRYF